MAGPLPPHLRKPKHPERICWGCSRYCPADSMVCGNGSIRAPHPIELFGDDWDEQSDDATMEPPVPSGSTLLR